MQQACSPLNCVAIRVRAILVFSRFTFNESHPDGVERDELPKSIVAQVMTASGICGHANPNHQDCQDNDAEAYSETFICVIRNHIAHSAENGNRKIDYPVFGAFRFTFK